MKFLVIFRRSPRERDWVMVEASTRTAAKRAAPRAAHGRKILRVCPLRPHSQQGVTA